MPFRKGNKEASKKGKHKKTLQWEILGEAITTIHAERFSQILNNLDDDKFADKYLQVLEYFKPKQQRANVKHDIEQSIKQYIILGVRKNEHYQ